MNIAFIFILGFITGAVIALIAKHEADNPRPDILALPSPEFDSYGMPLCKLNIPMPPKDSQQQEKPEGIIEFEFDGNK